MSLESIALIGVMTLLSIFLGTDILWLLVGYSSTDAATDPTLLDTVEHLYQMSTQRLSLVFAVLLIGAVVINLVSHTRTEVYLLRIGLGGLLIYMMLALSGLLAANHQSAWLLWPRMLAALVSFWSFLHYGMNPKL